MSKLSLVVCFSLTLSLLLALPASAAEITLPLDPEKGGGDWEFDSTRVQAAQDELHKRPALQPKEIKKGPRQVQFTTQATLKAPLVLEAEVRLPTPPTTITKGFSRAGATLGLVVGEGADAAASRCELLLSRGRAKDDYSYSASARLGDQEKSANFKPLYTVASISPLMDESMRMVLERTTQQVPIAHEVVHRLRVEIRKDLARMYVDGRLIGERSMSLPAAKARLTLSDDALLLSLTARPLEEFPTAFTPVPLDAHCNAKGPGQPQSLAPRPGRISQLEGVPFITSGGFKGEDHLDLAPSVYMHRLGIFRDGDSRESVFPPEEFEMTRFTLRVPERTYRRAWVLAAADGDPSSAPVLTVRFYRPKTAWTVDAEATSPTYTATSAPGNVKRVAISRTDGKTASLWLIPIELDAAALAVEPMTCLELTKAIYPYRSWPDPAYFNSYPGGLPSGVHVYGVTLEEAPLWARGTGTNAGNLYPEEEQPVWRVLAKNLTRKALDAQIQVSLLDPYGKPAGRYEKKVKLAASGEELETRVEVNADKFGLYTVETMVKAGDFEQTRNGTFLRLPKSTRKATGANSPWGVWCWTGTHDTIASIPDNARILKALGAINNFPFAKGENKQDPENLYKFRQDQDLGVVHYRLVPRTLPEWAMKDPIDPAAYKAYAEEKGKEAKAKLEEHPDLQFVNFFAENHISLRVTHGMSPWAMGQPYFDYTKEEADRIRAHWIVAKAALEGVRKHAPQLKVLFGHGAGNFVQPFLRLEDWRNDMFDGFGMDLPQFERMPERQPRATEPNLLFFLHEQMQNKGLLGKEIVHLESYYPSSHPLGLTFDEQAASTVRTAALSMSLGTTRFMRTWAMSTCGDGWGASHYGCTGLLDRAPESNPKPAAAAFATMTQVLDLAKYDGWLDTGSRSAFCLRFRDDDRLVYCAWTIRGTRPLELAVDAAVQLTLIDMQGNASPVKAQSGEATVHLSSQPQWIVARKGAINKVAVGTPEYLDKPASLHARLEDFESHDWSYEPGVHERFQNNHWDMPREPGEMSAKRQTTAERGSRVMRVQLLSPNEKKPLVGFYGVFAPPKPITIPGQASALGMQVNGRSAWNRFIYEIVDAKGEKWLSCGTRDAWNCDDIHSWSSINHDGWRYMRFPLPSNAPGDHFREADTVWWGSDAEGIVDLPLKLTRIIVEMRPQMIYVDELLPIKDHTIELDDLVAEYDTEQAQSNEAVALQRAAYNVMTQGKVASLANPHAELQKTGVGAAPKIAKVYPPADFYNGTRLYVDVQPASGAARYRGYVSAHADGQGAKPFAIDQQSTSKWAKSIAGPNTLFFDQLRPATPMYVFVTTLDAEGRESKPSAIREVILKDEFPFK